MSVIADPLALYGRLIDKGVDNALARALSDALHETPSGLATEASVTELREETRHSIAELREETRHSIAELREEMRQGFASIREESVRTNGRIDSMGARVESLDARIDTTNGRIDVLSARIDALPNALFIRLGSLMVVLAGGIVTALHLWPPH